MPQLHRKLSPCRKFAGWKLQRIAFETIQWLGGGAADCQHFIVQVFCSDLGKSVGDLTCVL